MYKKGEGDGIMTNPKYPENTYIPDLTEQDGPYEGREDPEETLCQLCLTNMVKDPDSYCPECQVSEAEYREDK